MSNALIMARWCTRVDGMHTSSREFYRAVEEAVGGHGVKGIDWLRVRHREGGALSAKREYLRVRRGELQFDVCAAPYGNGFFVSWWLVVRPGCLSVLEIIPGVGFLLRLFLTRMTYYRLDTIAMFRSLIHDCVSAVLNETIQTQGLRSLTVAELAPQIFEKAR